MSILARYYVAFAAAVIMIIMGIIGHVPILLIAALVVIGYPLVILRCPTCRSLVRFNRHRSPMGLGFPKFPERICRTCGRDLSKP